MKAWYWFWKSIGLAWYIEKDKIEIGDISINNECTIKIGVSDIVIMVLDVLFGCE